ncbi:hypothetical protein ACIQ7D_23295 [Streptomyces sp. NPDC096310]|uniref:hypothetical protein n=1 Tax=Streptomyces sp. NPDC096310 TaxID=3366082 RepID=UPI003800C6C3
MQDSFEMENLIPWGIGMGVLLLCLLVFFNLARNEFVLKRRGVMVAGICVGEKPFSSVIRYTGPDGAEYERTVGGGSKGRIASMGDEVQLVCDPRRPKVASAPPESISEGVVHVVLGVVLLVLTVRLAIWPFWG